MMHVCVLWDRSPYRQVEVVTYCPLKGANEQEGKAGCPVSMRPRSPALRITGRCKLMNPFLWRVIN